MQRPPNRITPSILFARGTSEWIRRVSEKHKQLASLKLSNDTRSKLEKWTEVEFVHSALALEGILIDREKIVQAVSSESKIQAQGSDATMSVLFSLRKITALARGRGKSAYLTVDLLLDIHSAPEAGFRKTQAA